MKVGEVIRYDSMWGVISKVDGSWAQIRIQDNMSSRYFPPYISHSTHVIDLVDYYTYHEHSRLKTIWCKIHRGCEEFADMFTQDWQSLTVLGFILVMMAFVLGAGISAIRNI